MIPWICWVPPTGNYCLSASSLIVLLFPILVYLLTGRVGGRRRRRRCARRPSRRLTVAARAAQCGHLRASKLFSGPQGHAAPWPSSVTPRRRAAPSRPRCQRSHVQRRREGVSPRTCGAARRSGGARDSRVVGLTSLAAFLCLCVLLDAVICTLTESKQTRFCATY